MPGTRPRTSRFIVVILRPPSTRSSAQTASTVSFSGGDPAELSVFENAIAKQVAWAAAISSSGLVLPSERSVREANVTGRSPTAPLPTWTRPDPCVRLPSQTTSARRSASAIAETLLSLSKRDTTTTGDAYLRSRRTRIVRRRGWRRQDRLNHFVCALRRHIARFRRGRGRADIV